jgi:hypothetical protein
MLTQKINADIILEINLPNSVTDAPLAISKKKPAEDKSSIRTIMCNTNIKTFLVFMIIKI